MRILLGSLKDSNFKTIIQSLLKDCINLNITGDRLAIDLSDLRKILFL